MSARRRFKPYPAYKDSGVEWLGEIPAHWEVKPLKRALRPGNADGSLIKGRMHQEPGEGLFPGFSASGQDIWVEEGQHDGPGIVLSAVGARCGKTFKADGRWTAVANTHVIFTHDGHHRDFLWYLTNNEEFWDRGGTAQPFVRVASTLQRSWCFPSPGEQRAIAAFLDRETARIDALVAKKGRLIELLQEKRTALITRAVTKGLDPTVPMKDSGVEWLGKIPAHWEVKRLKTIASVQLSNVDKKSVEGQEPVRLCNYTDVYYNERITADLEFMPATATPEQVRRFALRAGDVLITKDSESWTDIAVPAVVSADLPDVLCGYHLAHIRPADRAVGAFLSRAFSAIGPRDQFQVAANGITRYGLGGGAIRIGLFAMPPSPEQRAIAVFLDRETARIDALIAKVRDAIERLKELRTALISAAVTGKIDVREEAA